MYLPTPWTIKPVDNTQSQAQIFRLNLLTYQESLSAPVHPVIGNYNTDPTPDPLMWPGVTSIYTVCLTYTRSYPYEYRTGVPQISRM